MGAQREAEKSMETELIIAGGGPVGMGLAIDLGQRGHQVTVIERWPEPQPIPKGQNLTQRTMEHFRAWNCEDALRAARITPRGVVNGGLTCYGNLLSGYYYDWLPREQVRPFYFTDVERLPQYATEAVLRQRAAELETVTLHYGQSAIGLSQNNSSVTLTHAAKDGPEQQTTGQYLIGCDGSHSLIRQAAGITQTRSDHDRKMVLLVFKSTQLHQLLSSLPERSFYNTLHPDLDGYWQFLGRVDLGSEWFFHAPVPADTTADNYDFHACLHRAVGQPFDLELTYVGFWDLRIALADSYRQGRVFIAGDAAHSHPPYGGYGINIGFEDARNLGWKLSASLSGWGNEGLLDSYEAERRPVFASTATDFIENFISEDRLFLQRYNPQTDKPAFEAAWQARNKGASEVHSFAPNYDGSPIISGSAAGARPSARGSHQMQARPGYHLSPVELASGENVYERLGSGFTLLDFSAEQTQLETSLPLCHIASPHDPAADIFEAETVLVRPDEFIAYAGPKTGVESALAKAAAQG